MWFINNIVSYCNSISDFFYSIYQTVQSWVYPFYYAAGFFYSLCTLFNDMAWAFYYFGQWAFNVASQITYILSWSTIQSYILWWLPNLQDISNWFYSWWSNVTSAITSWWSSTQYTVQGWIDIASSWLQSQINTLNSLVASLQSQISYLLDQLPSINEIISWFTDWWGNVLAAVIAWGALTATEISTLIDSKIKEWSPLLEGWLDWKDALIEFIQDPEQWFYDRLEEVFDRFW